MSTAEVEGRIGGQQGRERRLLGWVLVMALATLVVSCGEDGGPCVDCEIPGPDLRPTGFQAPESALPGARISVLTSVSNDGSEPVPALGWRAYYYLSPDSVITSSDALIGGTVTTPALDAGGTGILIDGANIPSDQDDGYYYLGVIVDPLGSVAESDESNNVLAMSITIGLQGTGPDLAPVSLTGPGTVEPGQRVTIFTWIANAGTEPLAAGSWTAYYYLSTDPVITTEDTQIGGSITTPALAAGELVILTDGVDIPEEQAEGLYYLGVIVDPEGEVAELSESNNTLPTTVTVVPASDGPDLVPLSLSGPGSAQPEERVSVQARIANAGTVDVAAGAWTAYYYLSTDPVITTADTQIGGSITTPALAAGVAVELADFADVPEDQAEGLYYFGVIVDPAGVVVELSENNNALAGAALITISAPPRAGRQDVAVSLP